MRGGASGLRLEAVQGRGRLALVLNVEGVGGPQRARVVVVVVVEVGVDATAEGFAGLAAVRFLRGRGEGGRGEV